jgi:hypothetical protein
VTLDEELNSLEDNLRRLKIEYDVYFAGGSKKPPEDIEWRVRNTLRKCGDGRSLSFQQQFRYNTLAQKYGVFSDVWRRKLKIKEEGYRRPQDALLAIQGLRPDEEKAAAEAVGSTRRKGARQPFRFEISDPQCDVQAAQALFAALSDARKSFGTQSEAKFDSFLQFLCRKTAEIRTQYGCGAVEYAVVIEGGQVKLKARSKAQS